MPTRLAVALGLLTATGALVAGFVGAAVAIANLDVGTGLALRSTVVAAVVLLAPRLVLGPRVLRHHRPHLLVAGMAGLLLGYGLNPFTWNGRAFFAQAFVEPGPATIALDLLGWLALGGAAVLLAVRPAAPRHQPVGYEA